MYSNSLEQTITTFRSEWVEIRKVEYQDIETSGYHVILTENGERRYPLTRKLALTKALEFLGYDSLAEKKIEGEN